MWTPGLVELARRKFAPPNKRICKIACIACKEWPDHCKWWGHATDVSPAKFYVTAALGI